MTGLRCGTALLALCVLGGCGATSASTRPPVPVEGSTAALTPFLQRLTGEWEYEAEAVVAPGQPPVKLRGTERSEAIGSWLIQRTDGETPTGRFTSLLTLGYDKAKDRYVGTFVASVADAQVTFEGTLEPGTQVLTLEAVGSAPRQRDVIELLSNGDRIVKSMVESEGQWVTFLTSRYHRRP